MARMSSGFSLVLAVVLGWTPAARADQWPAPRVQEVFSESREWFVRVVPGSSLGETVGFAGSARGPRARSQSYRRQADRSYRLIVECELANPVAPAQFLVTDHGFLVALDNWHNLGFGTVLASYGPRCERTAALELAELFSREEIDAMDHSVSSIQWRKPASYVRADQRSVQLTLDERGTGIVFEPESGIWQLCAWRPDGFRCRSENQQRRWKPYREPGERP